MDWLAQNWLWVLFAVAFFGMHLFGHGGHGGHGGGGQRARSDRGKGGCGGGRDDRESSERSEGPPRASHQH